MRLKVIILLSLLLLQGANAELLEEKMTDESGDVLFINENSDGVLVPEEKSLPLFDSADLLAANYSFDTETNKLMVWMVMESKIPDDLPSDLENFYFVFSASNSYDCSLNTCSSRSVDITYNHMTRKLVGQENSTDPIITSFERGNGTMYFETNISSVQEVFTRTRKATYTYTFYVEGYFTNESSFSDSIELMIDLSGNIEFDVPFEIVGAVIGVIVIAVFIKLRKSK